MRGVIISCPRAGQIWGTPAMSEALEEITSLGANWASIHPYAWVGTDGAIRFRPAAETGYLADAVERMRRSEVRIFWKPHLGYWGSFEWRGSIDFDTEEKWQRFFADYRAFIVDQAAFAERHGIELLAVGVEYERTMHREDDWRAVIAAVRAVYSGTLTYAANWDGVGKVGFWDAVDLIGVHGYFPLSGEEDPDAGKIEQGWSPHLRQLAELSSRFEKRVLFAEIGYNRATHAAREPWTYGSHDTPGNRLLRERLMDVALARLEQQDFVAGMFWWKWMPGGRNGRDFSLKEEEARRALARHWVTTATIGGL